MEEHDLSAARHAAELVVFAVDATSVPGSAQGAFVSLAPGNA